MVKKILENMLTIMTKYRTISNTMDKYILANINANPSPNIAPSSRGYILEVIGNYCDFIEKGYRTENSDEGYRT